jgi:hypothetical protein
LRPSILEILFVIGRDLTHPVGRHPRTVWRLWWHPDLIEADLFVRLVAGMR